ncbi:hypothetical protein HCH_04014 [Hahella chejuensis KCTC 2396]|uniref:Uncharacterized protein n=1 Tax=Hahella chejuensis (strain KCTC 2396) TaxID=349521 RepID=Q2SF44_HAHCH|nr:hypothetical protein [Hahella chejuensis]ABC30730.1 hypothetical protein HCH_04014 [Hahella chejuensis KCTC 2396]
MRKRGRESPQRTAARIAKEPLEPAKGSIKWKRRNMDIALFVFLAPRIFKLPPILISSLISLHTNFFSQLSDMPAKFYFKNAIVYPRWLLLKNLSAIESPPLWI